MADVGKRRREDPGVTTGTGPAEGAASASTAAAPAPAALVAAPPLQQHEWSELFDPDGRIVAESGLRKAVFRGGICPDIRKECWKFILGALPCSSTYREREVLVKEQKMSYAALKERWTEVLVSPEDRRELELGGRDDQEQFMYIQAKLNAMRHVIDEASASATMKAIKKDVPRTDRNIEYFSAEHPEHLTWLHDVLVTFAVFQPEVGYAQGMNDVLSMILVIMDDEAEAYSCFSAFMQQFSEEFTAEGMMKKLESLVELLSFMDPDLYAHFQACDAGDLVFCHRWLLLSFKREFLFDDAVKLFEILCSHHLELTSSEAEKARDQQVRVTREQRLRTHDGLIDVSGKDVFETTTTSADPPYTFSLFVALAILHTYRARLLQCKDVAEIFQFVNSLVEKMELSDILRTAEQLFFEYCRRSVTPPEVQDRFLLKNTD